MFGPENQGRSQAIAATTTTKRLRLRALTGDEILAALWTRRLPDGGPWPVDDLGVLAYRADQVERLEDQAEASFLLWVATTPQGDYVGRVGCHAPPSAEGVVEIGYYVREVHRGRGLAHEMVNAFISWLTAHDVRRVRAMVRPGNHASITVLRSVGFGPTGRSVVDAEDGLEDEYCLAITSVSHVLAADQERLGRGATS